MKKIISILVCFISVYGMAQTYTPSQANPVNKPLGPAQAIPTDSRSYYYDATNFRWRYYQSTAEVLSYLSNTTTRAGNFPIYVNVGGTLNPDGTWTGGTVYTYMFRDGTSNGNLVLISPLSIPSAQILVGNASNIGTAVTLSGDATISNTGVLTLASTGITPGSYTNTNLTVDAKGRITAISNGSSGGGITGTLVSGQVPYATGTSTVATESAFAYNSSTNVLSVDKIQLVSTSTTNAPLNIGSFGALPTSPSNGDFAFRSSDSAMAIRVGTNWLTWKYSKDLVCSGCTILPGSAWNVADTLSVTGGGGSVTESAITTALKYKPGSIASFGNNRFIRKAAGVFRPDVSGGIGSTTTWSWLTTGGHTVIFFDSVVSVNGSNSIRVYYPRVKNLLSIVMNFDETLSGYPIDMGPTVATNYAEYQLYYTGIYGGTLTGNGTGWSTSGNLVGFSYDYGNTPGTTRFNIPSSIQFTDYDKMSIVYNGDSLRIVKRKPTGLGSFNYGFTLCDPFGNAININPQAGDKVVISTNIPYKVAFTPSPVTATVAAIFSSSSNVWIEGVFEVYLAATPVSTTSNYVEWQAYTGATSYKIYRSTNADFSGESLIYSGTNMSYQDTGLTTNTLYYYRMVAVVSGVDTEVTRSEKCTTL